MRCTSGSPILTLTKAPDDVEFKGNEWDGFRADAILSVSPADEAVEEIVCIDPVTFEPFVREVPRSRTFPGMSMPSPSTPTCRPPTTSTATAWPTWSS